MIRRSRDIDMEAVLAIWLETSTRAHDFVEPEFWKSQLDNMRSIYIPGSKTFVYESNAKVVGFYALHEDCLAAIFVIPAYQGQGIGKALLTHAKAQRSKLTLSVYKENEASCQFYLSQDFHVVSEQTDEHTGHLEFTMTTGT